MTELQEALTDLRSIRRQVAETTEFRGYGPVTLSATAGLAVVAGMVQAHLLPAPAKQPWLYVALWLSTAVVCAALIATEMLLRAKRLHHGMADDMIRTAVLQFLPAGVAGAALPFAVLRGAPGTLPLLPGLWQLIFSLGVFASCRSLPRPMLMVGMFFLASGIGTLASSETFALHPACMAGVFAVGMAMVAAIHHVAARRGNDDAEEG